MVPLTSVVRVRETTAPQVISHFNLFRSARSTAPPRRDSAPVRPSRKWSGSRQRALPQGFGYAWSGISLEEIKAGAQSAAIFGIGLLLVYLTLAAQYESWCCRSSCCWACRWRCSARCRRSGLRGLQNDCTARSGS